MNEITKITPENFEVANSYLKYQSADEVAQIYNITPDAVLSILEKSEVKRYIDNVYLEQGYRNRNKLGALLDRIIEQKVTEAEDTGIYTKKDLLDILELQHKMRMDEIKASQKEMPGVAVQINNTGYSQLMEKLLGGT